MDWISVVFAALAGAIGGAVASLLVGTKKDRRLPFSIIVLVVFFSVRFLFDRTLVPKVQFWQADREIRQVAFYKELAEDDPTTYATVQLAIMESVKRNEGADAVQKRISPIIANTVPKYIGAASDESVLAFAAAFTRQLRILKSNDTDACYYFMFPAPNQPSTPAARFSKSDTDEMVSVMYRILHSSVHSPQPLPDEARSDALLQPILIKLQGEYGRKLSLLQQKPDDAEGRATVCTIAVSLYEDVESLKGPDASLLLRHLMAANDADTHTR